MFALDLFRSCDAQPYCLEEITSGIDLAVCYSIGCIVIQRLSAITNKKTSYRFNLVITLKLAFLRQPYHLQFCCDLIVLLCLLFCTTKARSLTKFKVIVTSRLKAGTAKKTKVYFIVSMERQLTHIGKTFQSFTEIYAVPAGSLEATVTFKFIGEFIGKFTDGRAKCSPMF